MPTYRIMDKNKRWAKFHHKAQNVPKSIEYHALVILRDRDTIKNQFPDTEWEFGEEGSGPGMAIADKIIRGDPLRGYTMLIGLYNKETGFFCGSRG